MYDTPSDAAAAERASLEFTDLEDQSAEHQRYRRRRGTHDACRMSTDHDMPRSSAPPEEWAAWHEKRTKGTGGWDPCNLIR